MRTPQSAGTGTVAAAIRLDAGDLLAPAQRDALGAALQGEPAFADDLLFLLVASLRDRCSPAHAHELARMALAARLPVLEGAETVLKAHPEWRSPVYALVRQWASSVPCGREVHVVIGGYQAAIEPERYARMFPDSFFDPALDVAPPDIAGRSLGERGADPCTPVIYTLLPLDAEEAWACLGWRATSRRRLGDTCRAAIHGQSQVDPQTAGRLAVSLRSQWQDMPATCR